MSILHGMLLLDILVYGTAAAGCVAVVVLAFRTLQDAVQHRDDDSP